MNHSLKFTVLTDNIESGDLKGEWGLSVYLEYGDHKILLDTGASELFLENAAKLGIHLESVDLAVLSHAHYDHANGMPAFFGVNHLAKFYLSTCCHENCFSDKGELGVKYIGIPKDTLNAYRDRIIYASGKTEIADGVTLLTHTTPNLQQIGAREKLFVEEAGVLKPDDFAHEQSLIFETEEGLVIFNSCCHAGAAAIVNEVSSAFPDRKIAALIGGFHLYNRSEAEVREFARKVRDCGVGYICTGHCTGETAYAILAEELGETAHQLHCGLVKEFQ